MVVPTAPFHPTVAETLENPLSINSSLGIFSHFANVLGMCGIAVPAGTYSAPEGSGLLPFSVTLLGAERTDAMVLDVVEEFEAFMMSR